MQNSTINYLLYFGTVFVLHYSLPKKTQPAIILVSSIVFCALINIFAFYCVLLNLFIFYGCSIISGNFQGKARSFILISGIFITTGGLIVLKYLVNYNNQYFQPIQFYFAGKNIDIFSLAIPVGISYYSFTGIGYLIELLNKRIEAEKNFLTFANFIVFFPKFSAGPIERANKLLLQLRSTKSFNYDLTVSGTKLIMWGLFKKVVIADRLAVFVNAAYAKPDTSGGLVLLLASVFYSIQIYTDFSGYTDIARGSAKILGYDLLDNFKRPYFSKTISEFWTRWHISLSSWIRDYLFIPIALKLTSSKVKSISMNKWLIYFISTAISMTVIGVWHGIGVGFILWSSIHITYLFFGFILKKNKTKQFKTVIKSENLRKVISTALTFILITFAWIFFRAESGQQLLIFFKGFWYGYSFSYLTDFMNMSGISIRELSLCFCFPIVLFIVEYLIENKVMINEIIKKQTILVRFSIYILFTLMVLYFSVSNNEKFIYFQF